MFYLTTHSTHFIYGYMASDIWLRTILIVRKERERNVLFNDTLNTFYLRLYCVRHMVKDHSDSEKGEREMFYLTTHSTHFIYGYMASDIWLRTILIVRKERERNVLFNDALNTFYLRLYGIRHMVKDHSDREKGEREMFYLTTHSTHFIYGDIASDIWLRTILIVRKVTRCRHIGYSYRLTARVLLYAPSHRQDNTYHSLCYTSRGALAGTRNSSLPLIYVPLP